MKAQDAQKQLDTELLDHIAQIQARDAKIKSGEDQIKSKDGQIQALQIKAKDDFTIDYLPTLRYIKLR
jgi:hypothetical protein